MFTQGVYTIHQDGTPETVVSVSSYINMYYFFYEVMIGQNDQANAKGVGGDFETINGDLPAVVVAIDDTNPLKVMGNAGDSVYFRCVGFALKSTNPVGTHQQPKKRRKT